MVVGLGLAVGLNACKSGGDDSDSAGADVSEADGASLYRPGNRFSGWGGSDPYLDDIQPILAKRCVTCHGCTTAACQLKLTSYEGVTRGANAHNLFSTTVFTAATGPTRLKDGVSIADWRKKGFYSDTDKGKDSTMWKLLEAGKSNKEGFDTTNANKLYSGKAETLGFECLDSTKAVNARLAQKGTGMPFGVPTLPAEEMATLQQWLEAGAPGPSAEAQKTLAAPRDAHAVADWEAFFNQQTPKARLAARYLYEHLFYARLHIDDVSASKGDFFELVRSRSQTGPVDEIVTDRPNDDPKVAFTYRLKKHTQIITEKDHTVVHLTSQVKARWKELLFDSDWSLDKDPGYASLNPFVYFDAIPGKLRYQIMLESSQRLIEAMVKGDVCTGSSATYAIRDRFFTVFLSPDADPSAIDPKLGQSNFKHLDPSANGIFSDKFESLYEAALRNLHPQGLSVDDIWDGGQKDKNAYITVFRHGTNASAHFGPIGQFPETMWVLDFGNFERLYYDLVVLFRPWGALTEKLSTWDHMSAVRAHGEDLFLLLAPEAQRDTLRTQFTPGVVRMTETGMPGTGYESALTDVDATHPLQDIASRIQKRLGNAIAPRTGLDPDPMTTPPAASASPKSRAEVEAALYELTIDHGAIAQDIPDVTWIDVEGGSGSDRLEYTLLANRIFSSNSRLLGNFLPGLVREPDADSISVVKGHIGAFPQLFLHVPIDQVPVWIKAARSSPKDHAAIRKKFEVVRNTAAFWTFLEQEHANRIKDNPLESGIVDSSRYLWPAAVQPDPTGKVE
jgi:hypothetical protein